MRRPIVQAIASLPAVCWSVAVLVVVSVAVFVNDLLIRRDGRRRRRSGGGGESSRPAVLAAEPGLPISAVVLNWNGERFLREFFDSLLEQTFDGFEVILADNGSTDGSLELVRRQYPQVRVVALGSNLGFSKGVNAGISESRGRYVALFNNDVTVDRRWMAEMKTAIASDRKIGLCASKLLFYHRPDTLNAAGDLLTRAGEASSFGFDEKDRGQFDEPAFVLSPCAAAAVYRRSMLREVGLFDEDFGMTFEDIDLGMRAHWQGWRCLYVPTAVVHHHWIATIGHLSPMNVFHISKNHLHLLTKNLPAHLWIRWLPFIFVRQMAVARQLATTGSYSAFFKGKLSGLREMPGMLRKRNRILPASRARRHMLDELLERGRLPESSLGGPTMKKR